MPPKKDIKAAEGEENHSQAQAFSENEIKLMIIESKRNTLFERMQYIYNLSKTAHTDSSSKNDLLSSAVTLQELRSEFCDIMDRANFLSLSINSAAVPNFQALSAFDDLYSHVKYVLSQLEPGNPPPVKRDTDNSHHCGSSRPRLPPIELMIFDGDIKKWPLFYAAYKSTVHDSKILTDEEKLYFLMGKLTSGAMSVFAGITPSAENYELIFKTLIDKYEDVRTLSASYLDTMLNFKPLTAPSSTSFELFLEKFVASANALKNLKIKDLSDLILLHISLKKLDPETVRAFEMDSRQEKIPAFNSLINFIKNQSRIYQHSKPQPQLVLNKSIKSVNFSTRVPNPQSYVSVSSEYKCLCNNSIHEHLYKCPNFMNMSPSDRFKIAKEKHACVNCLSIKHKTMSCRSNTKCRTCHSKHHSLLHFENEIQNTPQLIPRSNTYSRGAGSSVGSDRRAKLAAPHGPAPALQLAPSTNVSLCTTSIAPPSQSYVANKPYEESQCNTTVLLATAQVIVYDCKGDAHLVRALIDTASQSNFITHDLFKRLGLQLRDNNKLTVKGIGGSEKIIKGSAHLQFYSRFNLNNSYNMNALIVDRITECLPTAPVEVSALSYLQSLPLADRNYGLPAPVQMLIGASLFPHLIVPGIVTSKIHNTPPAIQTTLGFIIMGSVPVLNTCNKNVNYTNTCCAVVSDPMDGLLKRFWELEEVPAPRVPNAADAECEEHFRSTTVRDSDGRYTVALPFSGDPYTLGDSFKTAQRRFLCLERKLEASPDLRTAYDKVIWEYIDNGYLSLLPQTPLAGDNAASPNYYLAHHAVIRKDKATTKLRVVLDGGCKSSNGVSLNDLLHQGPNLQGNLFDIIMNFRLFAVALSADCKQMFLQVGITPADRDFLRILYRFNPHDSLSVYHFNRVCFGLRSSPYHALRVVHQLIDDEKHNYEYAELAKSSLYMDDINFSVMTEPQARQASTELIKLFKSGQFDLVKWASNSRNVLTNIPLSHKASPDLEFEKDMSHKILGMHWNKLNDHFYYEVTAPAGLCTKRTILATVARLWDLMGFVAPTVLFAKLLIKELWLMKCDWDDTPPDHIISTWISFCTELPLLNKIRIPRHIGIVVESTVNLVGFADSSERAYGAVVYAQVCNTEGITVNLVCAKSKVSPTKPISIARLELCAAVLLSDLLRITYKNLNSRYKVSDIYAFTDSMVTLYWIHSPPHRWQTFVANRVGKIADNIPVSCFRHVAGVENPADCLSRGLTPNKLLDHPLWFRGPLWLASEPSSWPVPTFVKDKIPADVPEQKSIALPVTTDSQINDPLILHELALRMSSYSKLLRVIVYIYRMLGTLQRNSSVTASDLNFAEIKVLKCLQTIHFSQEIKCILNKQPCCAALRKLNPFVDNDGLLRVGGRLSAAQESYDFRHSIILPSRDHLIDLIIDYFHKRHLHAGPELLMSLLRQRYWIISARGVIRRRIHKCNICFKSKPQPTFAMMADLPPQRVNQVLKAFTHTGVDYAGPLLCTPYRCRGVKGRKTWICVFTCLTTRATHIEMASDLSTACFLNAFKRFLSRRGPIRCMYSDCGTNFVGARSYLRDLYKFLNDYHPQLENELADNRIDWKNAPPAAPHFSGCMESMVKIVKSHLFKVIGDQILSYEELNTVLTQVEALMNSRPLTVLSTDPSEPSALTPSHFLHTAAMLSFPVPPLAESISLNQRHMLLDRLVQSFWKRWRTEYLHQLQSRAKWNTQSSPIQLGTVVIIIKDNAPVFSWPLGVVEKIHPSKDGIIRVVTVKTANGSLVRPTVKLCPLPTQ